MKNYYYVYKGSLEELSVLGFKYDGKDSLYHDNGISINIDKSKLELEKYAIRCNIDHLVINTLERIFELEQIYKNMIASDITQTEEQDLLQSRSEARKIYLKYLDSYHERVEKFFDEKMIEKVFFEL